jgi:hypothetical protein
MKPGEIDSLLDTRFTQRNSSGLYEVFVLSEEQGRGTDLKTNIDIEKNGGNYLMVVDIFETRSEQQVIGRTGRLDNRGQWHYFLYAHGSLDTIDVLIKTTQQTWLNEAHSNICKLVALLGDQKSKDQDNSTKISKRVSETKVDMLEEEVVAKFGDSIIESEHELQNPKNSDL